MVTCVAVTRRGRFQTCPWVFPLARPLQNLDGRPQTIRVSPDHGEISEGKMWNLAFSGGV